MIVRSLLEELNDQLVILLRKFRYSSLSVLFQGIVADFFGFIKQAMYIKIDYYQDTQFNDHNSKLPKNKEQEHIGSHDS